MPLDAAGCPGWLLMLKMTLDTAECLSINKLCFDVLRHFYDGQDNPSCSWMSWMTIDAQDYPG